MISAIDNPVIIRWYAVLFFLLIRKMSYTIYPLPNIEKKPVIFSMTAKAICCASVGAPVNGAIFSPLFCSFLHLLLLLLDLAFLRHRCDFRFPYCSFTLCRSNRKPHRSSNVCRNDSLSAYCNVQHHPKGNVKWNEKSGTMAFLDILSPSWNCPNKLPFPLLSVNTAPWHVPLNLLVQMLCFGSEAPFATWWRENLGMCSRTHRHSISNEELSVIGHIFPINETDIIFSSDGQ